MKLKKLLLLNLLLLASVFVAEAQTPIITGVEHYVTDNLRKEAIPGGGTPSGDYVTGGTYVVGEVIAIKGTNLPTSGIVVTFIGDAGDGGDDVTLTKSVSVMSPANQLTFFPYVSTATELRVRIPVGAKTGVIQIGTGSSPPQSPSSITIADFGGDGAGTFTLSPSGVVGPGTEIAVTIHGIATGQPLVDSGYSSDSKRQIRNYDVGSYRSRKRDDVAAYTLLGQHLDSDVIAWNQVSFDGGSTWVSATKASSVDQLVRGFVVPLDWSGPITVKVRQNDGNGNINLISLAQPLTLFNVESLTGQGLMQKQRVGGEITIRGTGFSTTKNTVVFLGGAAADVEASTFSHTSTLLKVIVPQGAKTGKIQVKRNVKRKKKLTDVSGTPEEVDVEISSKEYTGFELIPLEITGMSPTTQSVGNDITISGTGFATRAETRAGSSNIVTFLGGDGVLGGGDDKIVAPADVEVDEAAGTVLTVTIRGGMSGRVQVEGKGSVTSMVTSTQALQNMAVSLVHPSGTINVGEEVFIKGSYLKSTSGIHKITFLGGEGEHDDFTLCYLNGATGMQGKAAGCGKSVAGAFYNKTSTGSFRLPVGAKSGRVKITRGDGVSATGPSVSIRSLVFETSAFDPDEGEVGDVVTIKIRGAALKKGTDARGFAINEIDADWNEVSFGGGPWTKVATTQDSDIKTIFVKIPAGSMSGKVGVRLNDPDPTTSETDIVLELTSEDFTVTPTITGFKSGTTAITEARRGETIKIVGTGFAFEGDGKNIVTISGTPFYDVKVKNGGTELTVKVPDDAVIGSSIVTKVEVQTSDVHWRPAAFTSVTSTALSVIKFEIDKKGIKGIKEGTEASADAADRISNLQYAGKKIVIKGEGFASSVPDGMILTIGGIKVTPFTVTVDDTSTPSQTVVVKVPAGLTAGDKAEVVFKMNTASVTYGDFVVAADPIFQSTASPPTKIEVETYHFEVAENVGSTPVTFSKAVDNSGVEITDVTAVSATDPDGGEVTYALSGTGSDKFSIDSALGVISTIAELDHEDVASYTFTLIVTDQDGLKISPPTVMAEVKIKVNDVREKTEFVDDSYDFTIAENSGLGVNVSGTPAILAEDPDNPATINYTLLNSGGTVSDEFKLESTTSPVIRVKSAILNYEGTKVYNLKVKATDPDDEGEASLTDEVSVTISLTDVNEAPVFVMAAGGSRVVTSYSFDIAEGLRTSAEIVGRLFIKDPDAGSTITYELFESDGRTVSSEFELVSATSPVIQVQSETNLDYDTSPTSYSLKVKATDTNPVLPSPLTVIAEVTISLTNVDEGPMFSAASYSFTVAENANFRGTVMATDEDAGHTVTHTVRSLSANDWFEIGSATGVITKKSDKTIDYEALTGSGSREIRLTVTATSGSGGAEQTKTQTVTIKVTNVNEAPVLSATNYSFTIAEDASLGGAVTGSSAISATDVDAPETQTYTIKESNSFFAINGSLGEITSSQVFDYESPPPAFNPGGANPTYSFTVVVTDDGGETDEADVTITLTDVREKTEFVDAGGNKVTSYAFTIDENSGVGVNVSGTPAILAEDPDNPASISYTLSTSSEFELVVESEKPVIQVKSGVVLDFETKSSYTLKVKATDPGDGGEPSLTDEATVSIRLTDVNEGPVFDPNTYSFPVAENVAFSGTVMADDPDDGHTVAYSITTNFPTAAGAGWFSTGSSSGEISSPANTINYEALSSTSGVITLTIEATAGGKMVTQDVTITVSDVDEAPVFYSDAAGGTTNEVSAYNVGIHPNQRGVITSPVIYVADPEGETLTVSSSGSTYFEIDPDEIDDSMNATHKYQLQVKSGVMTNIPAGTYTVTISASPTDVTFTVKVVDRAPVFDVTSFSVDENADLTGGNALNLKATDPDGDLVSYSISTNFPTASTDKWFGIDVNGQISNTETINYEALSGTGPIDIRLTVTARAGGETVTEDVIITVSDVDEAPVFYSDAAGGTTNEVIAYTTLSAIDLDVVDGRVITTPLIYVADPEKETLTVSVSSQVNSDDAGVDYFELVDLLDDTGAGADNTDNFQLEVTHTSNIPAGRYTVTVSAVEAVGAGTAHTTDATFTVEVDDRAPVFDIGGTYAFPVMENAVFDQTVSAMDADGDLPSYRISATDPTAANGWFSIGSSSGEISSPVNTINYEALSGTSGVITLTVLATAGGKEATQVVTITVSDEDEAPVFYEDAAANTSTDAYTASITADQRGVITSPVIYAADPEGKTLSVSVSSQVDSDDAGVDYFELVDVADDSGTDAGKTDNFQLQVKSSVMTNIPAGRYAVTVSAVGPAPHTTDATFTVEVDDRAPVFVRGTYAFDVMENAVFDQTVEAMDADGDLVSYRLQSAFPTAAIGWFTVATGGQISSPANKINYEALTDDPREVRLTVLATAGGKEATQVVTITVSDVDEAPVFYNDAAANTPTDAYTVDIYPNARGAITSHVIYVADPEGETFTVSVSSQVDSDDAVVDYFARISDVAGGTGAFQLEITHTHNIPAGIYTVMVSAAENTAIGTDHTHSATVTVKVTDRAPVFTGTYAFTAVENAAFSETVSATDLDGDLLEYSLVTVPIEANGWFAINPNDGTITADANVIDYDVLPIADPRVITLTVTATPAGATARSKSATKDVTITVSDEDEAPVFYEDVAGTTSTPTYTASIETNASGELSAPVLYVSDAENESLTVSISSQTDPGGSGVSLFTIASYDDGEDATDAYKLSVSGVLSVGTYTVTVRATEPSSVGTDHTTDATVEITVAAPSADAAPVFYSDAAGATSTTTYTASIETNASGELSAPVLYVSDAENESLDVSISSQTDPGGSGVSLFTIASYDDGVSETHAYKLSVSGTLSVGTYTVMVSAVEAAGTAGTTAQTTDATVTITVTDPSATDSEPVFYSDAAATTSTSTYTASIETSASGDISDPVLYVSDEEMETLTLSIHSQVDGSSGAVTFFGIASFDDSNAATDSYRLSVTGASAGSYTVTVRATEAAGTGTDHTTDAVVTITVTDPSATDSEPVFYSDAAATTSTSTYTASIETSASGDISDPVLCMYQMRKWRP